MLNLRNLTIYCIVLSIGNMECHLKLQNNLGSKGLGYFSAVRSNNCNLLDPIDIIIVKQTSESVIIFDRFNLIMIDEIINKINQSIKGGSTGDSDNGTDEADLLGSYILLMINWHNSQYSFPKPLLDF